MKHFLTLIKHEVHYWGQRWWSRKLSRQPYDSFLLNYVFYVYIWAELVRSGLIASRKTQTSGWCLAEGDECDHPSTWRTIRRPSHCISAQEARTSPWAGREGQKKGQEKEAPGGPLDGRDILLVTHIFPCSPPSMKTPLKLKNRESTHFRCHDQ